MLGPSGSGKSSLLRELSELLVPVPEPGDTCVIVDQFEEVFTLCADTAGRDEFIEALPAANGTGSRLRVVLGIRADFYGRCLQRPGLAAVLRAAALPVGPMSADELREAIVELAAAHGLFVQRELTAQLVTDAVGEPGGLPLLSRALLETWRRRDGRTLTLDAYQAAGGLRGAIALTAVTLYTGLAASQADLTRRILLRPVSPGEGGPDTRRPADRAELRDSGGTDTGDVLERLARARLIALDGDTVDLAHEALLTAWPRLRAWIDEDRRLLLLHRHLTQTARGWHSPRRGPLALCDGSPTDGRIGLQFHN